MVTIINDKTYECRQCHSAQGKFSVAILGKDYEAVVEEYDSFGESAFNMTLKERKKKADG